MRLKCKFVINSVAGEIIAVPVGRECEFKGYIKINETAKDIFDILKNDVERKDIISALSDKYPDAEIKDIQESVDDVLNKLKAAGLLI